jgi:hypothetical protein
MERMIRIKRNVRQILHLSDDFVSAKQWCAMSSREKRALLKACSKRQKQKGNRQVAAATTTALALTEQNLVCIVDLLQQRGIGAAQTNNTLTDSAGDAFGGRARAACDKKHGA